MVNTITVLGSTGSIGTQSLDVARKLNLKVSGISAQTNVKIMEEQIREFAPSFAVMKDKKAAEELKIAVKDTGTKVLSGDEGILFLAGELNADLLLNSLVGMTGLLPTITAIKSKKNIALANKETLVAGGDIVMDEAKKQDVKILPVDSEHSAIFQCLQGSVRKEELGKIILTASGGPFFGRKRAELQNVTKEDALKHPNWSMGAKITIDSATMMNKGLELIEAVWLFDVKPQDIEIVIHRESIIHSLVEYIDHSVIAQLGLPDMRIPIQYAVTYPNRYASPVESLSLTEIGNLSFWKPDLKTFTALGAAKKAIEKGGVVPAMVNGANEEAVSLFLKDQISFLQIGDLVSEVAERFNAGQTYTLDDILLADREAREFVKSLI